VTRLLLVCLGGALGSGLRYVVTVGAVRLLGAGFPYGTLAVNLVGSFAIGLVQGLAVSTLALSEPARLFLTAGLMGGLTTYSAFSYETVWLAEGGAWGRAALNVGVTTAGSLALCLLGLAAGRALGALWADR
jgi:CrcB protein